MSRICSVCGAANLDVAKFCGQCGQSIQVVENQQSITNGGNREKNFEDTPAAATTRISYSIGWILLATVIAFILVYALNTHFVLDGIRVKAVVQKDSPTLRNTIVDLRGLRALSSSVNNDHNLKYLTRKLIKWGLIVQVEQNEKKPVLNRPKKSDEISIADLKSGLWIVMFLCSHSALGNEGCDAEGIYRYLVSKHDQAPKFMAHATFEPDGGGEEKKIVFREIIGSGTNTQSEPAAFAGPFQFKRDALKWMEEFISNDPGSFYLRASAYEISDLVEVTTNLEDRSSSPPCPTISLSSVGDVGVSVGEDQIPSPIVLKARSAEMVSPSQEVRGYAYDVDGDNNNEYFVIDVAASGASHFITTLYVFHSSQWQLARTYISNPQVVSGNRDGRFYESYYSGDKWLGPFFRTTYLLSNGSVSQVGLPCRLK